MADCFKYPTLQCSCPILRQAFIALRSADKRIAAEYAAVLAFLHKERGNKNIAIAYGRRALELLAAEGHKTVSVIMVGAGILPDFISPEVVRNILHPLVLQ